jgi:hypothetical protein
MMSDVHLIAAEKIRSVARQSGASAELVARAGSRLSQPAPYIPD